MPFKTFTSTTLSSADVNTYLMKQTVIVCTSGTRPASPNEGMVIYETDTDVIRIYTGSAWKSLPGALQFLATRGTTFSISSDSTYFVVPFTTEVYDDSACYDPITGAFLAPRTGYVQFSGTVCIDLNGTPVATKFYSAIASLNSSGLFVAELARGHQVELTSSAWPTTAQYSLPIPSLVVPVTAGTRYGMVIWANAPGVTKTVPANPLQNQFSGTYVFG